MWLICYYILIIMIHTLIPGSWNDRLLETDNWVLWISSGGWNNYDSQLMTHRLVKITVEDVQWVYLTQRSPEVTSFTVELAKDSVNFIQLTVSLWCCTAIGITLHSLLELVHFHLQAHLVDLELRVVICFRLKFSNSSSEAFPLFFESFFQLKTLRIFFEKFLKLY